MGALTPFRTALLEPPSTTGASLAGTINGVSTIAAQLSGGVNLAVTVTATATVTAQLQVGVNLAATITATSTVTAQLSVGNALSGNVTGTSTIAAQLSGGVNLAVTVTATSTVSAQVVGGSSFAVTIAGSSTVTGQLQGGASMAATVAAVSTVTGQLTNPSTIVPAIGPWLVRELAAINVREGRTVPMFIWDYDTTAEDPARTINWTDSAGNTIDTSAATFTMKLTPARGGTVQTKNTGITGSASLPNITVTWGDGELAALSVLASVWFVSISARIGGRDRSVIANTSRRGILRIGP